MWWLQDRENHRSYSEHANHLLAKFPVQMQLNSLMSLRYELLQGEDGRFQVHQLLCIAVLYSFPEGHTAPASVACTCVVNQRMHVRCIQAHSYLFGMPMTCVNDDCLILTFQKCCLFCACTSCCTLLRSQRFGFPARNLHDHEAGRVDRAQCFGF